MADMQRKPNQSIVEPVPAAMEPDGGTHVSSGPAMVDRGTIPPVMSGFQTPGPSASDRAYPSADHHRQGIGAASPQGAQAADVDTRWLKEGTPCERPKPAGVCYLGDKERGRYVMDFKVLVDRALAQYQDALTWAKVEQLVQKDEEVSIVGAMLLSLASGWVLGHLVGALSAARNGALNHIVGTMSEQAVPGASTAERFFGSVTNQKLQSWTSAAFEPVRGAVGKPQPQSTSADSATEKQQTMSYIDYLKDAAGPAFRRFENATLADSDDASLLVAWLAMQPENHSATKYGAIVKSKVDGFKKSGVMDIGHNSVMDRKYDGTLYVDTRVVWVKGPAATRLHYQTQKSVDSGWSSTPTSFDGGFDRHVGGRVPDEFVDIALARSEGRWGQTQTVVDPFMEERKGLVQTTVDAFHRSSAPKPGALPPNSVFSRQAASAQEELAPFDQVPAGSIFDPHGATSTNHTADASDPLAPFRSVRP